SRGCPERGPQASGAGAWVTTYLGIEMATSFSPLSTGAGVGPNEATNMGLLAARPFTICIQSSSLLKTFSFRPTSQPMVEGWFDGLAMTILSFHLGSARSS